MDKSWGGKVLNYLVDQEGFSGEVYKDANGHETIGYGHKLKEGEEFSGGLTEEQGRQLLAQDFVRHNRIARDEVGHEQFDAMSERDQSMLALSAWNPGWGSQPKLVDAIVSGDREAQFQEFPIHAGGSDLAGRNSAYQSLFFPDQQQGYELDTSDDKTQIVKKKPSGIRTFVDSEEFQLMDEEEQVSSLAERDGRFAELLEQDPDRARQYAKAAAAAGRGAEGFTPTIASSLEGGLERGIGWMVMPAVGAMKILEENGIIRESDRDDDLLDWANQRVLEGGRRIGTSWEHQVAGIVASVGGSAVPGAILTGGAYVAGGAAGLSGVPLMIAAEGAGFGAAGFLHAYGESDGDFDEAVERGKIETALGGFGGLTSVLPRKARAPLDFAAALSAGHAEGLGVDQNVVQALSMTLLAGIPGARPSPKKLDAMGWSPEAVPAAQRVRLESEREAAAREMVKENLEGIKGPFFSRDGVEYENAAEAMQAMGKAVKETPEIHINPMDRSPEMEQAWANKEQLAAEDTRPLVVGASELPRGAVGSSAEARSLGAPAPGFTRLYRGESPTVKFDDVFDAEKVAELGSLPPSRAGKFYTDDIDYADYYRETYGKDAKLHWVDVPDSNLKAHHERGSEYIFSDEDFKNLSAVVDAEIPSGWNPGWRHVDAVPYGATPDRVIAASGEKLKRPGEIYGPFAKSFDFNVTMGNVKNAQGSGEGVLGWHWAQNREMKVLRRDDLQTLAHEWGHDIVVLEPSLSRYVQGSELGDDVKRLRGFLQEEEAKQGRAFNEPGVPSATLFNHQQSVPDDLKYIEELVALSYDRPNLREGFSEFCLLYTSPSPRDQRGARMPSSA